MLLRIFRNRIEYKHKKLFFKVPKLLTFYTNNTLISTLYISLSNIEKQRLKLIST